MRGANLLPLVFVMSILLLSQNANAIVPQPLVVPSGVVYYYPLTITNTRAIPTTPGLQQYVTLNLSINHFPVGQFYQNIEFFYHNGTIVKSWLENYTGPTLYPHYWLRLNPSLNGNMTGYGQNITIFVGYGIPNTNFYAQNFGLVGYADNIGGYGNIGYDNGGVVFNFYSNFNFSGSGWTTPWGSSDHDVSWGAYENNHGVLNNGSLFTTSPVFYSTGNVLEGYAVTWIGTNSYTGLTESSTNSPQFGNAGSAAEALLLTGPQTANMFGWAGNGAAASYNLQNHQDLGFNAILHGATIYGIGVNATNIVDYIGYKMAAQVAGTFGTMAYVVLGYFTGMGAGQTPDNTQWYYWARARYFPPGGVMPSVYISNVVEPRNVSLSPQSVTVDSGSALLLAAIVGNSTAADYYRWLDNGNYICGGALTSCTYTISGAGLHRITFNLTDAYTTTSATTNVMVNPALVMPSPTPNTQTVITGNSAVMTDVGASLGTAPYSYQWLEKKPGAASYAAATDCVAPTSVTCLFTTSVASAVGTYSFEIQARDSAYAPVPLASSPISVYVSNGITPSTTTTQTTTTTAATTTMNAVTTTMTTTAASTTAVTTSVGYTSVSQTGGPTGGINVSISTGTGLIALAVVILVIAVAYYLLKMQKPQNK